MRQPGSMVVLLLLAVCATEATTGLKCRKLEALTAEDRATHVWTGAEFDFGSPSSADIVKKSGGYIKRNAIATKFQYWKDRIVAVFPRYKRGVPFTVAWTNVHQCSPVWKPFPNAAMQEECNCDAMQNAVDIFIDNAKGRALILDSGITHTLERPIRRCPPKIVVICLKTQKVVRLIDLSRLTCPESRLQHLAVDSTPGGRKYVYVADAGRRSIIVWDVYASRGWRVVLPTAVLQGRPDVLYMTLVRRPCGTKVLYLTYLKSTRMFSINTDFLRQPAVRGRLLDQGCKPGRIVVLGDDGGTAMFFRYEGRSEIYRWDTVTCFKKQNFVLVNEGQCCRLATHVVADRKLHRMMALESNFPDFIRGTVGCGASHTIAPLVACTHKR